MKKPTIGIILDEEELGSYSDYPYYALRKEYFDAVIKAGGVPVAIPYSIDDIEAYLDLVDGLLVSGGDVDVPPQLYGETEVHETFMSKPVRTQFEFSITKHAMERDMPVLGICAGEQMMAVILGGTLIQDIPSEVPDCLEHQIKDRKSPAHDITIVEGTLLHKIIGDTSLNINSDHHQSVKNVGAKLIASAISSDGVIEAIESKEHRFCLGLQWHPEFLITDQEFKIFQAFIDSCR